MLLHLRTKQFRLKHKKGKTPRWNKLGKEIFISTTTYSFLQDYAIYVYIYIYIPNIFRLLLLTILSLLPMLLYN